MLHGEGSALTGCQAGLVHQATHVPGDNEVRLVLKQIGNFQLSHLFGNVGKSDGKGSAKSTALVRFGNRDRFQTFDSGQ